MLLQKIIIKNYRGISKKQEIDFSASNKTKEMLKDNLMFKNEDSTIIPLVIGFIGKNASGKSSIIEAIKLSVNLIFQLEREFNDFYSQKILNESGIKKQTFSLDASNENDDLKNVIAKNNKLIQNFVQLSFDNQIMLFPNEYILFLKKYFNIISCDQKNPVELEMIFKEKSNIYKAKLILTNDVLKRLAYKNDKEIEISNFPLILFQDLEFSNNFNEIRFILQMQWKLIELIGKDKYNSILSMLDNNIRKINYTLDNAEKIQFTSLNMNNGTIIPFDFLSSGTIKILKFVALMTIDEPHSKHVLKILLADEINNYLHPKLVQFLFNLLSKHLPNKQMILTTHSPSVLEKINRHAIWVIQNEESLKIRKVGTILRENNSIYNKFISEEISSHPSTSEMNEILHDWKK